MGGGVVAEFLMPNGTYVYCLIAARRAPAAGRRRRGLPGMGRIRLLPVTKPSGALRQWLAVADAPLETYGEDAINRQLSDLDWVSRAAIAHEAVVESFIEQPAVLPMKLFTIFANDDRALEHVHAERRRIALLVERVAGHDEWGVRVTLEAAARTPKANGTSARAGGASSSGIAYLAQKKAQRDHTRELAERSREVVGDLFDRLDAQAASSKRRTQSELPMQNGPMLLDAAFLVDRKRARRFTASIKREMKALAREGYRIMLTGPWPPYTFMQD